MRYTNTMAAALACSAALTFAAACSGSSSQSALPSDHISGHQSQTYSGGAPNRDLGFLAPQDRSHTLVWDANPGSGWITPGATLHRLVYVADQGGQAVYIFPQQGHNQAPIGKITDGLAAPNGLFVDKERRLYVCNFGGGTVTVYPHGAINPSRTLTGAGSAIDVVVGVDGTVYVSNWDSGTAGTLLEYPKGSNTPSVTININGAPEGLALDSAGNLYVAYNDATVGDGEVLQFAPGSTVGNNLKIHVGYVGGETLDSHGNLLLVDQNIPGVDVFPPGATQPSQRITGFPLAFDVALRQSDTRLWITDPFTAVDEVTYPGGAIVNSITNTITSAFGVATSPDGSR
jgi:hypothetical protein